jgi:beta-galactosidase/beta-glucuronidase
LGNESGYGVVHDKIAAWIRKKDRQRILLYEPASYGPRPENPLRTMATDVLCPMYARVTDCVTLANMFPDLPLIQMEYAHMMGTYGDIVVNEIEAIFFSMRKLPPSM